MEKSAGGFRTLDVFWFSLCEYRLYLWDSGQSITSLLDSLKKGLKFHPQEIFLYPLYVKHGAGLIKNLKRSGAGTRERLFAVSGGKRVFKGPWLSPGFHAAVCEVQTVIF